MMASEQKAGRQQLLLFLGERGARELAAGHSGMREGDRLYLSAMAGAPRAA
jgi:hypothetical protein